MLMYGVDKDLKPSPLVAELLDCISRAAEAGGTGDGYRLRAFFLPSYCTMTVVGPTLRRVTPPISSPTPMM